MDVPVLRLPRAAQEPQIGGIHAATPAPGLGEEPARAVIAKPRNRTSRWLPRTVLCNAKSALGKNQGLAKIKAWQKISACE
jgi:hypothetical protein